MGRPSTYTPELAVEIYALTEPGPDGAVRYIGKAKDSVKRFSSHLRDSRRRSTRVYVWIRQLIARGQVPGLLVLARVPEDTWQAEEQRMIVEARERGCDLLNMAEGGDQPYCSPELRAELGRRAVIKRTATPEKNRLYDLKRDLGLALKKGWGGQKLRDKCRAIALADPQTFPKWLNL